jgi:hypothetical protein
LISEHRPCVIEFEALTGDVRAKHPQEWQPQRCWPPGVADEGTRGIEMAAAIGLSDE